MRNFYYRNRIFFNKLLVLLGFFLFLVAANWAFRFIAPFFIGFLISLILNPLVGLLQRKLRIHRAISGAFIIIICILLITILGIIVFNRISAEAMGFAQDIPGYIEGAQDLLIRLIDQFEDISGLAPEDLDLIFGGILNQVLGFFTSLLQTGIEQGTINVFTAIPGAVLRIMITIISAFFFTKDKELIKNTISGYLPLPFKRYLDILKTGILAALAAYAKGQLIIMCIVFSICTIGLTIINSPYALLIGLGIAVFDLIPIVGAGWILMPWAAYNLLGGNISFAIGLLVIYGIIFLARQLAEPRIVAGQIGIHPIILLMSVYIGIQTIGPVGILVGPFAAVIIKTVMRADYGEF